MEGEEEKLKECKERIGKRDKRMKGKVWTEREKKTEEGKERERQR